MLESTVQSLYNTLCYYGMDFDKKISQVVA